MRKHFTLSIFVTVFVLASSLTALAQNANFNASRTFEFDPDKTRGAFAKWINGAGEADFKGPTNFGLQLEKNAPLSANVAAGAVLNGLEGVVVQAGDQLGYDIKDGSPCGAGAPRFNVSYTLPDSSSGFSFVGGCANDSSKTPLGNGWTRVRFELQNPGEAFSPIPPGSTLQSVTLIVDEPGKYTLDNIRFRDQVVDKPGISNTVPAGF